MWCDAELLHSSTILHQLRYHFSSSFPRPTVFLINVCDCDAFFCCKQPQASRSKLRNTPAHAVAASPSVCVPIREPNTLTVHSPYERMVHRHNKHYSSNRSRWMPPTTHSQLSFCFLLLVSSGTHGAPWCHATSEKEKEVRCDLSLQMRYKQGRRLTLCVKIYKKDKKPMTKPERNSLRFFSMFNVFFFAAVVTP